MKKGVLREIVNDTPLPKMVKIRQNFHAPEVEDVVAAVHESMKTTNVLTRISKGDRVAIGVGSRGLADLPILVREVVNAVKSVGGIPFIVPTMGSHGGATAEGQQKVLEKLGVTEDSTGAPIVSNMDVVQLGKLPKGLPVYIDKQAYEADKIIFIGRIKAHTAYRGSHESGLAKMITIGLGKQKGAESAHSLSFKYMAEHVPEMAKIVIDKAPLIFGIGTIENAFDRIAKIVAVPAEKIIGEEPALLKLAKSLMPRIMFDTFDVLVVDRIGKNIAGTGMDTNIIGRYGTPYATGGPTIKRIAVLDLSDETQGNAAGIGNADITTKKVFDKISWEQGFANALTSTVTKVVKFPLFMDTSEDAVKAAIKTAALKDAKKAQLVRIKDTLHLQEIWISEGLLEEAKKNNNIEILSESFEMDW